MMYSSFCQCNVDPITPHFHIIKLGFRGVYRGGSNVYQHSMFLTKLRKTSQFSFENKRFDSREKLQYIA